MQISPYPPFVSSTPLVARPLPVAEAPPRRLQELTADEQRLIQGLRAGEISVGEAGRRQASAPAREGELLLNPRRAPVAEPTQTAPGRLAQLAAARVAPVRAVEGKLLGADEVLPLDPRLPRAVRAFVQVRDYAAAELLQLGGRLDLYA